MSRTFKIDRPSWEQYAALQRIIDAQKRDIAGLERQLRLVRRENERLHQALYTIAHDRHHEREAQYA